MQFIDRQAKYPGRWTMKKSDGTSEVVTLVRNDEPIVEGTPINANTLNELSGLAISIDPTLSVSGKAADAKMTGDKIGELKEDLGDLATFGKNLFNKETAIIGYTLDDNGELTNGSSIVPNAPQYLTSDFIPCENYVGMYFYIGPDNGSVCFYDDNKTFISKVNNILYSNQRKIISTAKYLRFTTPKSKLDATTARVSVSKPTEPPVYDDFGIKINNDVNIPHDDSKVDKSQGIENSGKYLKIGEDGNIVPEETPIDDRMYVGEKILNGGTKDGDQTISIGEGACRDEKCGIIAIGVDAASRTASTDGSDNGHYSIAIGHRALQKNVTGDHNTAIGWGAMVDNVDGDGNTAVGEDALCHSVSGNSNTCVGNRSYQMGTGSRNVVIGATAMYSSEQGKVPTGDANVAIGTGAGANNGTGDNNTSVGTGAKPDDNLRYTVTIGALAKAHKSRQVVIGSTKAGTPHPVETILNGDIVICGTDMKFRKLIFNDDGTVKWKDVSANYSDYTN